MLNKAKKEKVVIEYLIVPSKGPLLSDSIGNRPLKVEQSSSSQLNSVNGPPVL